MEILADFKFNRSFSTAVLEARRTFVRLTPRERRFLLKSDYPLDSFIKVLINFDILALASYFFIIFLHHVRLLHLGHFRYRVVPLCIAVSACL